MIFLPWRGYEYAQVVQFEPAFYALDFTSRQFAATQHFGRFRAAAGRRRNTTPIAGSAVSL